MLSIRNVFVLPACVLVVACVTNPLSRTKTESFNAITLKGFTLSPGQAITIQAVDQNTGNLQTRGTTVSATSGTSYKTSSGASYTLYP